MAAASPGNGLESLGPVERMGIVGNGPHQFFVDALLNPDRLVTTTAYRHYVLIKNLANFSLLCVLANSGNPRFPAKHGFYSGRAGEFVISLKKELNNFPEMKF